MVISVTLSVEYLFIPSGRFDNGVLHWNVFCLNKKFYCVFVRPTKHYMQIDENFVGRCAFRLELPTCWLFDTLSFVDDVLMLSLFISFTVPNACHQTCDVNTQCIAARNKMLFLNPVTRRDCHAQAFTRFLFVTGISYYDVAWPVIAIWHGSRIEFSVLPFIQFPTRALFAASIS